MPSKSIDYSKTVIYKIVCNDLLITDIYVGSTTRFTIRKCQHKNNSINCNKAASEFKIYKTIRANGGWDNWSMIQIEEFPCANGNEARARERYWYEQLNATLNEKCPNRDIKEWRDNNREYAKEYNISYQVEKRDKLISYKKEYYEKNKDYIKAKAKAYRERVKNQI